MRDTDFVAFSIEPRYSSGARGRFSAHSNSARSVASGVRNSCDASAVN
jgi:hypothetical protein